MSGLDIDFSKITVISTEKKNQSSVVFPEEGWFVGAENACMGSDHFGYRYLYFPKFTTHTQNSWGGYLNKERTQWWTFNYTYSGICTDFLYICADRETANKLAEFLNSFPSKNLSKLDSDIIKLEREVEKIRKKQALLEQARDIAKILTTPVNSLQE